MRIFKWRLLALPFLLLALTVGLLRCGICSAGCPAFGRRGACETTATGAQGSSPTGEPLAYEFGWRAGLLDGDGPRVVEHTGATPGTFAHVVMLPEQHRAVIVLGRGYSEALAPARQVSATTWPGRSPAATPTGAGPTRCSGDRRGH